MIQSALSFQYDFISNVKGRSFPKGMSIEIVKVSYYESIFEKIILSNDYKEHVTSYLYEHENGQNYLYLSNTDFPEAAGIQFALDTNEDFHRSKRIIEQFMEDHLAYNMKEIYQLYKNTIDKSSV
jgi:spore coat polysaccharide biosynthesis protein SpsF